MIREHGPDSSTVKLCLYTVNAFMDDIGEAWPSQLSISKAARLNEKTVQRLIAEAIDNGWLNVVTRQVSGKAWKRYIYRASIPDLLERCDTMLQDKVQDLMKAYESQHGSLPKGGRTTTGPLSERGPSAKVPVLNPKVPALDTEGPRPGCHLVPAQDGTKFQSKFQLKLQQKVAVQSDSDVPDVVNDVSEAEIRTAIARNPNFNDDRIASYAGCAVEAVRMVRARPAA